MNRISGPLSLIVFGLYWLILLIPNEWVYAVHPELARYTYVYVYVMVGVVLVLSVVAVVGSSFSPKMKALLLLCVCAIMVESFVIPFGVFHTFWGSYDTTDYVVVIASVAGLLMTGSGIAWLIVLKIKKSDQSALNP